MPQRWAGFDVPPGPSPTPAIGPAGSFPIGEGELVFRVSGHRGSLEGTPRVETTPRTGRFYRGFNPILTRFNAVFTPAQASLPL